MLGLVHVWLITLVGQTGQVDDPEVSEATMLHAYTKHDVKTAGQHDRAQSELWCP